jgi:hypothetical protein
LDFLWKNLGAAAENRSLIAHKNNRAQDQTIKCCSLPSHDKTEQQRTPTRFEVFTAMKIQVEVFWFVTPCNVVAGTEISP